MTAESTGRLRYCSACLFSLEDGCDSSESRFFFIFSECNRHAPALALDHAVRKQAHSSSSMSAKRLPRRLLSKMTLSWGSVRRSLCIVSHKHASLLLECHKRRHHIATTIPRRNDFNMIAHEHCDARVCRAQVAVDMQLFFFFFCVFCVFLFLIFYLILASLVEDNLSSRASLHFL